MIAALTDDKKMLAGRILKCVTACLVTFQKHLQNVVQLTCTFFERGAGAHVDVVYPDVSSGATLKEALHHNLPSGEETKQRMSGEEEERKVEETETG